MAEDTGLLIQRRNPTVGSNPTAPTKFGSMIQVMLTDGLTAVKSVEVWKHTANQLSSCRLIGQDT